MSLISSPSSRCTNHFVNNPHEVHTSTAIVRCGLEEQDHFSSFICCCGAGAGIV